VRNEKRLTHDRHRLDQILLYGAIVRAGQTAGAVHDARLQRERTLLSPVLRPIEAGLYWIGGVDERREQHWLTYTVAMLLFHVGGFLIIYALMRLQAVCRSIRRNNPPSPRTFLNTAISFITNTNWQNYGAKHAVLLVQMLGLTHQNFLSAPPASRWRWR